MKAWNRSNIRRELLRTGMGFFVFAAAMTLINVLFFPYARLYHAYHVPVLFGVLIVFTAAFLFLGRKLRSMDTARLERAGRIAVPIYLAALFVLQIVLGYMMEYTPIGDIPLGAAAGVAGLFA